MLFKDKIIIYWSNHLGFMGKQIVRKSLRGGFGVKRK